MQIQVVLHGILRDQLPSKAKGRTTLEVTDGATVNDVVDQLAIKRQFTAAIAGEEVERTHILVDGQELHLFKMIAGGWW